MMKAIETRWKGYRFRSRLEARWAVFFERLGVYWEYEPQGFETPLGRYLPDFFLPNVGEGGLWVEIKPNRKTSSLDNFSVEQKLGYVLLAAGGRATLFKGDPYDVCFNEPHRRPGVEDWSANYVQSAWAEEDGTPCGAWDCPYCFCVCPNCGAIGFEFDGRGARVCGLECLEGAHDTGGFEFEGGPDKGYSYDHPAILRAAQAARSARFEHGEVPA